MYTFDAWLEMYNSWQYTTTKLFCDVLVLNTCNMKWSAIRFDIKIDIDASMCINNILHQKGCKLYFSTFGSLNIKSYIFPNLTVESEEFHVMSDIYVVEELYRANLQLIALSV